MISLSALGRPAFVGALLLFSLNTQAATVQFDGTTVTGILGLNIGGSIYDVTFEVGTGDDVAGGSFTHVFFGDSTGASLAREAIKSEMLPTNATGTGSSASQEYSLITVAYGKIGGSIWDVFSADYTGPPFPQATNNSFQPSDSEVTSWATFQAATVPIPTAAWLFGSGLLGLAGIGLKRK